MDALNPDTRGMNKRTTALIILILAIIVGVWMWPTSDNTPAPVPSNTYVAKIGTVTDKTVTDGHCETTTAEVGGDVEACVPTYYALVVKDDTGAVSTVRMPKHLWDTYLLGAHYDLNSTVKW